MGGEAVSRDGSRRGSRAPEEARERPQLLFHADKALYPPRRRGATAWSSGRSRSAAPEGCRPGVTADAIFRRMDPRSRTPRGDDRRGSGRASWSSRGGSSPRSRPRISCSRTTTRSIVAQPRLPLRGRDPRRLPGDARRPAGQTVEPRREVEPAAAADRPRRGSRSSPRGARSRPGPTARTPELGEPRPGLARRAARAPRGRSRPRDPGGRQQGRRPSRPRRAPRRDAGPPLPCARASPCGFPRRPRGPLRAPPPWPARRSPSRRRARTRAARRRPRSSGRAFPERNASSGT